MKRILKIVPEGRRVSGINCTVLNSVGYDAAQPVPAQDHASIRIKAITSCGFSDVIAPAVRGKTPERITRSIDPIRPYCLKNVTFSTDQLLFRKAGFALIPYGNHQQICRLSFRNGQNCVHEHGNNLIFKNRRTKNLEKGICAFGNESYNWYHWLIEILPTVMLAERLPNEFSDYPFLVPENILDNKNFRDSFEIFRRDRPVMPLRRDHDYRVKELVVIPPPTLGPINMKTQSWPVPSDYTQNIEIMSEFRERVLEAVLPTNFSESSRRVFLARPPSSRSYNHMEIEGIAVDRGFELIRPEKLTFQEQVELFQTARIVVGPSGAAWACSIFLNPRARNLVWTLENYAGGCFFSNLTLLSGADLNYLLVSPEVPISDTHDAFSAPYKVDPDLFAAELDALEQA